MTKVQNRPGDGVTGPALKTRAANGVERHATPGGYSPARPAAGLTNEHRLLSRMLAPEDMKRVVDTGIGPEVFEDLTCRAAYEWMTEYWRDHQIPPTATVMEHEFPTLGYAASVEEPVDWLVSTLQRRYMVNQVQQVVMEASATLDLDPEAATRTLRARLDEVVRHAGRTGPSFEDEFLRADQLESLPTPEPLITDVLARHTYSILRGRDATFKSFVALDWSLCLATGTPWQGKPAQRVRVLYVAGEGAHGVAARVRAWEAATGITVDPDWFVVRRSAVNLYRGGPEFDHLLAYVRDGDVGLVVLDTLRRMSGGAEGNGSDMGTVVDNIERLKRETAEGSVLTITHTDKGDNDSRGFSGIEDDADLVWSAKRENNTNEVALTCEKMKDGPDGHRFELRLRPEGESLVVESADPSTRSALFSEFAQSDQLMMAAMQESFAITGATISQLIVTTGLSQASAYRSRGRLLSSGRLQLRASKVYLPAAGEAEND